MTDGDRSFVIHGGADEVRARDGIPDRLAFSRNPSAAHRARQWVRDQGYRVSIKNYNNSPTLIATAGSEDLWSTASSDNEHLATARLLLLLAAEGVIELREAP